MRPRTTPHHSLPEIKTLVNRLLIMNSAFLLMLLYKFCSGKAGGRDVAYLVAALSAASLLLVARHRVHAIERLGADVDTNALWAQVRTAEQRRIELDAAAVAADQHLVETHKRTPAAPEGSGQPYPRRTC